MLGAAALVPLGGLPASPGPRHNGRSRNIVVILKLVVILGPVIQLRPTILIRLVDAVKIGQPPRIQPRMTRTRLRTRRQASHRPQTLVRSEESRNPSRRPRRLIRPPRPKLNGVLRTRPWATRVMVATEPRASTGSTLQPATMQWCPCTSGHLPAAAKPGVGPMPLFANGWYRRLAAVTMSVYAEP